MLARLHSPLFGIYPGIVNSGVYTAPLLGLAFGMTKRTGRITGPNGQAGCRDQLRALRLAHTDWSLSELGAAIGISRQRVHQLLVAEGLATHGDDPVGRNARRRAARISKALPAALDQELEGLELARQARARAYLQALGLPYPYPGEYPGTGPGMSPGKQSGSLQDGGND
jgi:hypothetical protein